jgi:Ni/Co efflux regulator RcnB
LILTAFAAAVMLAAPAAIAAPNDQNNQKHDAVRPQPAMRMDNNNPKKPAVTRRTVVKKPAAKKPTVTRRTVVNRNGNNGNVTRRVTTRRTNANGNTNVRVNVTRVNRQAPRRVRSTRAYVRPAGWYQKRWTYGERLPSAWFGASYYVSDFLTLGLTAPPSGYQWIRVGNDVVLVDISTGEIVQTDYDAYY